MLSQLLETLYRSVRRSEIGEAEGLARLGRFARMKIRSLGDGVLRRPAWDVATEAGWDRTSDAEHLALTQL